ncbi:MAG: AEC family transporter [Dysgonamonadaceae bacterium]|jgi:predicted permease|nr:AEC family transporter [Dysgonamonadaceae bacterium]
MTNFLFSLNVVAPLFVLMAVGYLSKRIKLVSGTFLAELNRFVFQFCLPVMLFQDIWSSYKGDFSNTKLIFSAVAAIVIVILISFCLVPVFIRQSKQRGSMIQAIYRSNFLIYGLPLATGMYGKEAVATISMLMGIMIPLYNILAVIILSIYSETETQRMTFWKVLKNILLNPLLLGCVFGLSAGAVHLRLPEFIASPIAMLAAVGSPLALFVMGGEFEFQHVGENLKKVLVATVARLILVPLAAITCFVMMGFRNVELSVLLTIFATPTAMASYIMAKNMGCDGPLSAQIVVFSTAFSCLTIFFFIFVLRNMGYL